MNSNGSIAPRDVEILLGRLVRPVLGLLAAVAIGWFIADQPNVVTAVMRLAGVVGFLVAVISPRIGLHVLILLAAYLDYTKRFVILPSGAASLQEVALILAAAPLTFAGVCLGLVIGRILHRVTLKREDWLLIWGIVAAEGLLVLAARRNFAAADIKNLLASVVNSGVYIPMVLVMGLVFRSGEELLRFFRFILLVFVPVAFYGMWQARYGFTNIELTYLASGLTQTANNLEDIRPRPFSTLSSPHAFAVTMAIMFLLCLPLMKKSLRPGSDPFGLFLRFAWPAIYFAASIFSFVRAGWAVWVFGIAGMLCFKSRLRTLFFYGGFGLLFLVLVVNAQFLFERLADLQDLMPTGGAFMESAFRLGTYSERLEGYHNMLTNSELWTWFGNARLASGSEVAAVDEVSHDAISQALINFGAVGLLLIVSTAVCSLIWLHKRVLRLRRPADRTFGAALLSILMGIMASGILTGNHLAVYPLGLLFWMITGSVLLLIRVNETPAEKPVPKPERVEKGMPLFTGV